MEDAADKDKPPPFAFLFDCDHPEIGSFYGDNFDAVFLHALKAADLTASQRHACIAETF